MMKVPKKVLSARACIKVSIYFRNQIVTNLQTSIGDLKHTTIAFLWTAEIDYAQLSHCLPETQSAISNAARQSLITSGCQWRNTVQEIFWMWQSPELLRLFCKMLQTLQLLHIATYCHKLLHIASTATSKEQAKNNNTSRSLSANSDSGHHTFCFEAVCPWKA